MNLVICPPGPVHASNDYVDYVGVVQYYDHKDVLLLANLEKVCIEWAGEHTREESDKLRGKRGKMFEHLSETDTSHLAG